MRAFLATMVLLYAATAAAQEFDIYDPNDFIDPRARGAVFSSGRFGLVEDGMNFTLMRIYGGRVYDYQWRNTSTGADLSFVNLATSFYRGDKQVNFKLTTFDPHGSANAPNLRGTLQAAQYFITGNRDGHRIVGRILLNWSVERHTNEDKVGPQLNHEFGVETDVRIPLLHAIGPVDSVVGSFIWTRRRITQGQYVDRLSYLYRFREIQRSNGRLKFNASLGFGTERDDAWHCCLARGVLTATFIVPRVNVGVNAAFAPTFSPTAAGGRRAHRELALYLDRTLIARLADIVTR